MTENEHMTAALCARLCFRRHAVCDSTEAALGEVRAIMCQAVRAAVDVGHAAGCDVDVEGDYWVAYPSLPKGQP